MMGAGAWVQKGLWALAAAVAWRLAAERVSPAAAVWRRRAAAATAEAASALPRAARAGALTCGWRLAVARVAVALEAVATTAVGVPTTAGLAAMGAAAGARLRWARRWRHPQRPGAARRVCDKGRRNINGANGIPFSTC
jgi:hypothetical protein